MINQANLWNYRQDPLWKIGVLVPRTHAPAVAIDQKNGNTLWQDAKAREVKQLLEYNTFIDKGNGGTAPIGYKEIQCHIIYDVKHVGQHIARLVAGTHRTAPNTESVYSGVVSLCGFWLLSKN
jgi:hypothetical protein